MRYVALIVVCGAFGFLLGRYLFPLIFQGGVLVVLTILLIAAFLIARAKRRGGPGS